MKSMITWFQNSTAGCTVSLLDKTRKRGQKSKARLAFLILDRFDRVHSHSSIPLLIGTGTFFWPRITNVSSVFLLLTKITNEQIYDLIDFYIKSRKFFFRGLWVCLTKLLDLPFVFVHVCVGLFFRPFAAHSTGMNSGTYSVVI